jgi:transcriptional regulator with XRE-family HTH domain
MSFWLWRLGLGHGSIGAVEPRDVFAVNLRARRIAAGLSQEALGKVSGMHYSEISRLERSKRDPRLGTIVKLARALNVKSGELLAGAD